jgi:hypothetical protein
VALGQVKDRAAAWVAWSMLAIFVVGCGTAVTLEVTASGLGPGTVTLFLAFTGFMVVGAVIVDHRPDNAIGWIFSAIGLLAATGWLATEYAIYAYVTRPGPLPGCDLGGLVAAAVVVPDVRPHLRGYRFPSQCAALQGGGEGTPRRQAWC